MKMVFKIHSIKYRNCFEKYVIYLCLFFLCLCVYCISADAYVLFTNVRDTSWMSGISLDGSSILFTEAVSQSKSNPELAELASLPSQVVPGIPCLSLQKMRLQVNQHTHKAFLWVLGIWTPILLFTWQIF